MDSTIVKVEICSKNLLWTVFLFIACYACLRVNVYFVCVRQIFFLYMYMKIFKTLLYLKRLSWSCFNLYGSIHFYSTFNIYIYSVQKILKIHIYNCSIFYFLKSLKYVQRVIVVFMISLELPPYSKYIVSLHIAYIYIYIDTLCIITYW